MTKKEETTKKISEKSMEDFKFKGRYLNATGKRKTSIARVRLYKSGGGIMVVNDRKINDYFTDAYVDIALQSLAVAGLAKEFDLSVITRGGGKKAQAEAIRHGIARALVEHNKDLKSPLRAQGFITRDARRKERKKPGLKRARRAPQWSKR